MAFTQTDVDALKAALATGALKVRYADGREVTYRSLSDLQRAIAIAAAEVSGTGAETFSSNRSVGGFTRNLSGTSSADTLR
jgi:hypothetical protein